MRRLLATMCLAGAAALLCAADQEETWRQYLEWLRRQPITVYDTHGASLGHLRQSGLSESEIHERGKLIEQLARERRAELYPLFFDRTYASPERRFNVQPNTLLVETVRDLNPGRALDVHMGQGRNAIFLASRGWKVTGFDYSAEGVRIALAKAAEAGVSIDAIVQSHEDFDFGRDRWDLVVMSYTWMPLREPYISRIVKSIRRGGLLVFENMMELSGSENAAPWLPRPNELLRVFGSLRILRYEDVRAAADWSWRPERVARLVAEN